MKGWKFFNTYPGIPNGFDTAFEPGQVVVIEDDEDDLLYAKSEHFKKATEAEIEAALVAAEQAAIEAEEATKTNAPGKRLYAQIKARALELGVPVKGKADELEAAVLAAEKLLEGNQDAPVTQASLEALDDAALEKFLADKQLTPPADLNSKETKILWVLEQLKPKA